MPIEPTAEPGLRERKKQRVRAAILEVAERRFRAQGFDETTVDEIAAEAEISRQTFFNYFPSKEAALAQLGLEWLRGQTEVPRRALASATARAPFAGIRSAMRVQLRAIEGDRDFMRLVFTRSGLFFPQGPQLGQVEDRERVDATQDMFRAVAGLMEIGQKGGTIRRDVPAEQIAELYVSVMVITIRLWLIDYWGAGKSLVQRGMRALDVLEAGLRVQEDER